MQARPISGIRDRSTRDAAAIWAALALAYIVFAGSVSLNEGFAAIGCATLGTAWWWAVGRRGGTRFHFGRQTLRPLGPAIRDMPRQTLRIGMSLVKAVLGREAVGTIRAQSAAEVTWATPSGDTAPAARAVGLLAASLAPESYVLTLDRAHGTVTTHVLKDDGR
ncbi:hypothetical protein MMSR116_19370 [Methylobacterium mesophilicum SR1.6/6]|uniref:Uncharacterized protein n=1 Tax=Methylobacterium mesophilicum SR1.6/6 TaxID=908290 RepID=A0A6B9FMF7_9HYPH|nr:hypothetical protein [Methylobacterium mesophilicum]QGY03811.1 hypothetical protein MMSR116_19370 [Methylobacterium mesophilicum SR1.6/6]